MKDPVKKNLKIILINTLHTVINNTQSSLAVSGTGIKDENAESYFKLIYPYALLAFQCVYNKELGNVAKYEVKYDDFFSIKEHIEEESFEAKNLFPISPVANKIIPEAPKVHARKRLAYSVFLTNIMALYDAGLGNSRITDILLRLIFLLFDQDSEKLLYCSSKNRVASSKWKIAKLERDTLKSISDVIQYVYGQDKLDSKLEMALFDSHAMLWHLSGEPDELDFEFSPKPERCAYIDITTLIGHISKGKNLNTLPTTKLPILKEKVRKKQKSESEQEGYYSVLFSAYTLNNYDPNGVETANRGQQASENGLLKKTDEKLKNKSVVLDEKSNY